MNKLTNKELTEMLRTTFADATPDRSGEIVNAAKNHNNVPTVSVVQENLRGKYLKPAALIAAAALLVFGLIYITSVVKSSEVYSTVLIESDTCIEIGLNRQNRPVSIGGLDASASQLAKRIDKGTTLDEAVDNTLDAMRESGSLSELSNTVLITADAPDDAEELLESSFEAAKDSFASDGYIGAILTTVASDEKDIQRMARRYRISIGKAEMITDILSRDRSYSAELLSRLSVNDLNLLSAYRRIPYSSIGVFGASRGCITPDDAIGYVSTEAGFSDTNAEVVLGVDAYGLIYRVTLHGNNKVYIYRLDAANGQVIAVSQGDDLKTALMTDRNTPSPPPPEKKPDSTTAATDKPAPKSPETVVTVLTDEPVDAPQNTNVTPTEGIHNPPATIAPKPTAPATPKPTAPKRQQPISKPKATEAPRSKPTAAPQQPTSAPQPQPTQPPKTEPAVFTSDSYLQYSGGIQKGDPTTASSRRVGVRRIANGYNVFFDNTDFPYSPVGKQGGISALVCNREQFYRLTGRTDSSFDDAYFESHALYIHMNRDVTYHWIKSVKAAYMEGGTLCIENSEPVGYYIRTDSKNPPQIYTVVYELNKSELEDITGVMEYTE